MSSFISTLLELVRVVELRMIGGKVPQSGFFDNEEAIHKVVEGLGSGEFNFYVTLNKFDVSRFEITNRLRIARAGFSVGDKDVTRIMFLYFDFDPVREPGRQSDDAALSRAIARAKAVREHLAGLGWPEPVLCMSGSGAHLLYRCDLPNDNDTKMVLEMLYKSLESRFSDDDVKFDVSVRNPSRITKLYGTLVWYPKEPFDTEKRKSSAVVPEPLMLVSSLAVARACACDVPQKDVANERRGRHTPRRGRGDLKTLDIAGLFRKHDLYIRESDDGKHAVMCPWRSEHTTESTDTATVVWAAGSGGKPLPGFKCMHAHCEHRTLSDVVRYFPDTDRFCEHERSPAREREEMEAGEAELVSVKKESPNVVAARVMREHELMQVSLGSTYEYTGSHWQEIDDFRLGQLYGEEEAPHLNSQRRRNEGVSFIKVSTVRRVEKWNNVGIDEVPVPDGIYSVTTGVTRPHKKEDFLQCITPRTVDTTAVSCPVWERCLADWFGGDHDFGAKINVFQEFFGQALLPHNAFKKALVLYGDTDTGKSLAIKVLESIVGDANVPHLSISNMGDDSACSVLAGKLLNTVNDIGKTEHLDDGGFKRLTGGDEIVVNEKYIRRFSYRPIASHVIACNTLPKVDDKTDAVYNRLLILIFNRRLKSDEQNKWLLRDLMPEMPAILNWSLDGARRLLKQGDYSPCPSSSATVRGYKFEQNDAWAFITERAQFSEGATTITLQEFRGAISEWLGGASLRPRIIRDMVRAAGYDVVLVGACEMVKGLVWKSSIGY